MSKMLSYGIDFGTTNSTIAAVDSTGIVKLLPIDHQSSNPSIMRSVIFTNSDQRFLYGSAAIAAYIASVAENKGSVKKIIHTGRFVKVASNPSARSGFKPDKIVPEIIEIEESLSGRLFQGIKSVLASNLLSKVKVYDQTLTIEQLVGHLLKEIKQRADYLVGESVTKAVVGRPAEYVGGNNKIALERMEKALRFAGFTEFEFEYEPVGAALDYGIDQQSAQTIMVFDFGGGTLDISIVNLADNKVVSTIGLPIGGDYFNSKLFSSYLAPHFGSQTRYGIKQLPLPRYIFNHMEHWFQISLLKTEQFFQSLESFRYLSSNPDSIQALKALVENNLGFSVYEEIERVKKTLSSANEANFSFSQHGITIDKQMTRSHFESLISDDLHRIEMKIQQSLDIAHIGPDEIDAVITTGGSTLIPAVKTLLSNQFGPKKLKHKDTFTSVASGLALKAQTIFSHPH